MSRVMRTEVRPMASQTVGEKGAHHLLVEDWLEGELLDFGVYCFVTTLVSSV